MKIKVAGSVCAILFIASSVWTGTFVISDFEDGTLQGWYEDPDIFGGHLFISAGGNPGYCMAVNDTIAGAGGLYVYAPAQYTGDLSGYAFVQWDEFVPNYGEDTKYSTSIVLRSINGTRYTTSSDIDLLDVWNTRLVALESCEWILVEGTESFPEVLAEVEALYIRMDTSWRNDGELESKVDNVMLIPHDELPEDVVLHDHFNDCVLGPEWDIAFEGDATAWTYDESGSWLNVVSITKDDPAVKWASVNLRRPCSLTGNFNLACRLSWNSHGSDGPMQNIRVILKDSTGDDVIYAGYHDAWDQYSGEFVAGIDETHYAEGWDLRPQKGVTNLTIMRDEGIVSIAFDGDQVISAFFDETIDSVSIRFDYSEIGVGPDLIDESIDFITIDHSGATGIGDASSRMPRAKLYQNHPNPFNPMTTICYEVWKNNAPVTLRVYDVKGRLIRTLINAPQANGSRSVYWDGKDDSGKLVSSGIYFYQMAIPGFKESRKMLFLR